jgi:6-phosphogluconolactonase
MNQRTSSQEIGPTADHCFATLSRIAVFALLVLACLPWPLHVSAKPQTARNSYFVYVGTYTFSASKGIYLYRFDANTGQLDAQGLAAQMANPSFAVIDPSGHHLYAVTEMGNRGGSLSSFSLDPQSGALTFLNKVDSGGNGTCHLALDKTGRILFAVNYATGSVVSFAINSDGSIGARTSFDQHTGSSINPERQPSPHPHEVVLSPDNRFLFVPDLGNDRVYIYNVDLGNRTFAPHDPAYVSVKAGLGPRHFLFGPGAKFAYLVCEMGSTVVVYSYDSQKGVLTQIQAISTLPEGFTGEDASAEIQIDNSGQHLYTSNRGNDSISEFAIDPEHGTLTKIEVVPTQGKWPRCFALDPTGRYVLTANQNSDELTLFSINEKDGRLTSIRVIGGIAAPVSILFVPSQ